MLYCTEDHMLSSVIIQSSADDKKRDLQDIENVP